MPSYDPRAIEPLWQRYWIDNKTFRTPETLAGARGKFYILDMFPYPSGSGLHVGHPEGYTATDILARYRRMRGDHVLHPMGWDAFGLPAEQHAINTGEHPHVNTQRNIDNFRRQIQALGFSYDWDREVDTTDPGYFKWTQWIFLVLFDTWYDAAQNRGRPIAELPIPADVQSQGENAVRAYRDSQRLAYQSEVPVNWCEALGTVLANEEVIDGKSERGNHPVIRMPLRQWLLRITAYAERLIDDLAGLDWSESIKKMQRDWIGRSEGAEVDFAITLPDGSKDSVRVYTTRPDTLFGATYMVLAPEHPLVEQITTPEQRAAVESYRTQASRKSDFERTELAKTKTGVWTGASAINPVNGASIPIWIADYVLATYGTGAIMAVPAHDDRDFEFARTFQLPIRPVVRPGDAWMKQTGSTLDIFREAYCEEGIAFNSGEFDGLTTTEFKAKIIAWLEEHGLGKRKVNYKLRDWLFSRQRYWGEPFPILHEIGPDGKPTGAMEPLGVEELPLTLPEVADYRPTGKPEPPLSKAGDWLIVERNGKRYRRETNTMPQWAGSCWYYLRFIDPRNEKVFCDPQKVKYWLPVDLYVGGAEHAVLHLLYSRFWHKVLFDRGHVPTPEPFHRLVNQGMILGETDYYLLGEETSEIARLGLRIVESKDGDEVSHVVRNATADGKTTPLTDDQIEKQKGKTLLKGTKVELSGRADKMSKSRGNVINPDDVVAEYGADSLRLYEMFMGPLEATKPWNMRGVEGVYRFLTRVWRLFIDDRAEQLRLNDTLKDVEPDTETQRLLHRTIQRVTDDLDGMRFNVAIAAMMEFTNHLTPLPVRPRRVLETFLLLLAPFAPHLAEEIWHALGHPKTLAYEPWPGYDPALILAAEVEVPVQLNGKIRVKLMLPATLDQAGLEKAVMDNPEVQGLLAGKTVRRVIVPPRGGLVNIVVG